MGDIDMAESETIDSGYHVGEGQVISRSIVQVLKGALRARDADSLLEVLRSPEVCHPV